MKSIDERIKDKQEEIQGRKRKLDQANAQWKRNPGESLQMRPESAPFDQHTLTRQLDISSLELNILLREKHPDIIKSGDEEGQILAIKREIDYGRRHLG